MRVRFTASYNHRWSSRAATFFPAGYSGTVKRVVGETAIAKGLATEIPYRATPATDALSDDRRPDPVVGADIRPHDAARRSDIGRLDGRDGGDACPADVGDRALRSGQ